MSQVYETEAQFQRAVIEAAQEFPISIKNYGIISGTKYECPRAALTAEGVTLKELSSMPLKSTPTTTEIPYGYCHCGCGEKTSIPTKSAYSRGVLKGVPNRYIYGHSRRTKPTTAIWNQSELCFEIPLSNGGKAIIDPEDVASVTRYTWFSSRMGHSTYAMRNVYVDGKKTGSEFLHQHISGAPDGLVTDHIDGDGLNNRRTNLRVCTRAENNRNRVRMQSTNTSGYRGVRWRSERSRWDSRVKLNRKVYVVGSTFLCPIEAAIARDVATIELHGEFATLNFPELAKVFGGAL